MKPSGAVLINCVNNDTYHTIMKLKKMEKVSLIKETAGVYDVVVFVSHGDPNSFLETVKEIRSIKMVATTIALPFS